MQHGQWSIQEKPYATNKMKSSPQKNTLQIQPPKGLQSRGRQPEYWTFIRVRGISERAACPRKHIMLGWLLTGSRGGLHTPCSFPGVNGFSLKPRYWRCSKSPDQPLLGHLLSWLPERQQPWSHTQSAWQRPTARSPGKSQEPLSSGVDARQPPPGQPGGRHSGGGVGCFPPGRVP